MATATAAAPTPAAGLHGMKQGKKDRIHKRGICNAVPSVFPHHMELLVSEFAIVVIVVHARGAKRLRIHTNRKKGETYKETQMISLAVFLFGLLSRGKSRNKRPHLGPTPLGFLSLLCRQ
jgi:hypothetical protein